VNNDGLVYILLPTTDTLKGNSHYKDLIVKYKYCIVV